MVGSRGLDAEARTRSRRASERAFSILELLVVVVVLGLLVAAMIFAVKDSGARDESFRCRAEETRLETALASYKGLTGEYPRSWVTLTHEPHRLLDSVPKHHIFAETPGQALGTGICAR